mmetsp:Transcript_13712/g.32007  ORF Transcript_13712/g.32007 Transcript_13712/m.32007 type:complete len:222 (-) Transcript_13712:5183-5848(-)
MSRCNNLIQLQHLLQKPFICNKTFFLANLDHFFSECIIFHRRDLSSRENIFQNFGECRHIFRYQFWKDIVACTCDESHPLFYLQVEVFLSFDRLTLQTTGTHKQSLQCTKAKIVMALLCHAIFALQEQINNTWGKLLGRYDTLTVEHYLCDQFAVGNNHGNRSEQRFQIVRQVTTTCVSWIHRNESCHVLIEADTSTEQIDMGRVVQQTLLNSENLLTHGT